MKLKLVLLSLALFYGCTGTFPEKELYSESFKNKKTWTIMIYMNGDNNLSAYTLPDIKEMEKVDLGQEINVLVLWDRFNTNTYLLKVRYNGGNTSVMASQYLSATINSVNLNGGSSAELNMLAPNTLSSFVDWGKLNYPADYYAVIFWGHGDGWRSVSVSKGVAVDCAGPSVCDAGGWYSSGTVGMKNLDLALALQGKNITAVGFDNCLQGSMETLWALKKYNAAQYLAASPDLIPGTGWNYNLFLNFFRDSFRRPSDFGAVAVSAYRQNYSNEPDTSFSAFDLAQLDITSNAGGSFVHFFNWAGGLGAGTTPTKLSEKNILSGVIAYEDLSDLHHYLSKTQYLYSAALLNALDKIIYSSWKQGYGSGKFIGIKRIYESDYSAANVPLAADSAWENFIAP